MDLTYVHFYKLTCPDFAYGYNINVEYRPNASF